MECGLARVLGKVSFAYVDWDGSVCLSFKLIHGAFLSDNLLILA